MSSVADFLRALGPRGAELLNAEQFDIAKLATTASAASPADLSSVADFLRALGPRGAELLNAEQFDIAKLATTASAASPADLSSVADFLRALGPRRAELLNAEQFDISRVAQTLNEAPTLPVHMLRVFLTMVGPLSSSLLGQLVNDAESFARRLVLKSSSDCAELGLLLDQLGPAKASVMVHLDLAELAAIEQVCSTTSDVVNMTLLVRRLDDATRKAFIPLVAWMRLLQIPSIDAGNLLLLGLCLGNLRWRASARPSELDDVKKWILGNVVSLRSSIVDAYATVRKKTIRFPIPGWYRSIVLQRV
jgi:hypothetical protein